MSAKDSRLTLMLQARPPQKQWSTTLKALIRKSTLFRRRQVLRTFKGRRLNHPRMPNNHSFPMARTGFLWQPKKLHFKMVLIGRTNSQSLWRQNLSSPKSKCKNVQSFQSRSTGQPPSNWHRKLKKCPQFRSTKLKYSRKKKKDKPHKSSCLSTKQIDPVSNSRPKSLLLSQRAQS